MFSDGNRAIILCDPFLYVTKWSNLESVPPIDMENVWIGEGTNLLIDVDTSLINTLYVNRGRVIFADKHLTFRASRIVVNEG